MPPPSLTGKPFHPCLVNRRRTPAAAAAGDDTALSEKQKRHIDTLRVSAVDFYNTAMQKIFDTKTGQEIFGYVDLFNPMYLPDSVESGNANIKNIEALIARFPNRFTEKQWIDVKKRPEKFEKYIEFLKNNGYFDLEEPQTQATAEKRQVGLLSGLANNMLYYDEGLIVDMFKNFIQDMEILITTNGNIFLSCEVTLHDIVSMSTSVKSKPYYCDSVKLFIAVLTAVKHLNSNLIKITFKFSKPGLFQKLSGLQKSFFTCSPTATAAVPTGDPGDPLGTNYFKFNIDNLTSAAAAAVVGGSKLMRRNRRHRNRKHTRKTRRGRGRSHKRASKSHKRA